MNEAVIVAALRTAVGKAPRGTLRTTRPDDMAAAVIAALLKRTPNVSAEAVDDVILGCAMPEAESGMNVARIAALRAGLPDSVPAVTVNRFCSSGSQSRSTRATCAARRTIRASPRSESEFRCSRASQPI